MMTIIWDTDCNAGNVGAIVGTLSGAGTIPKQWKDPLNDEFSIRNFYGKLPEVLNIRDIAERIYAASLKN